MSRVILLTGVTGKFGRVFLEHLLELGHSVIGTASKAESMEKLIDELGLSEKRFYGVVVDLCETDGVHGLLSELNEKHLYPDCLINNARSLDFLHVDQNGIVSRANFLNEYLLDVVVPYELGMNLKNYSENLNLIINIGSQYGVVAANTTLYDDPWTESPIHYSVAKAGLVHLTKELAVRLADGNVQVNCIAYGGVAGRTTKAFQERYSKMLPLGRMLNEHEIVWPVEILLGGNSAPISGQTLNFDGGWTIW